MPQVTGSFPYGENSMLSFFNLPSNSGLEFKTTGTTITTQRQSCWFRFCQHLCSRRRGQNCCIFLNDKVSRLEVTNSRWKIIKDSFPENKCFRSYPSIKISRFAVSVNYRGQNVGTKLMDMIKDFLYNEQSRSAFRFITVDAYLSAIPFYEKNGVKLLSQKSEGDTTRLMLFDIKKLE